jgi:hypothetical protein
MTSVPPVKRPRGRPRKNPLPVQQRITPSEPDAEAAESLAQLPICTTVRIMEPQQLPTPPSSSNMLLCRAFMSFLEEHLGGEAWLKKLIAQETAREVRGDPRTEEMKLVKLELEKMSKIVSSLTSVTKEDKELDKRILEEAQDLKRKQKEVSELVEPLSKKAMNMEAQQKALQARMNAMEDRVRAVEMK